MDPNQIPQNVVSDLDLHCLPRTRGFLDISAGSEKGCFFFLFCFFIFFEIW